MWPRAASKLYEEPKKLVAHGLARASTRQQGARTRTVYTITAAGRRALAAWLDEPGAGPVLEFEQLVQVFFAEAGPKSSLTATLSAAEEWARSRLEDSRSIGEQYADGTGPFPERLPQLQLTSRFLTDFYVLVGEWARWAASVVDTWPDDVRDAEPDPAIVAETLRRAGSA
jgi:DNA-binding PadR family transcriptional regulator